MKKSFFENFFEKEKTADFNALLICNSYHKGLNGFLSDSVLLGCVSGFSSLSIGLVLGIEAFFSMLFFLASFVLPGILNYFLQVFLFEKRKRKKESLVPDLLLQASIFPSNTNAQRIINYAAKSDFGLLSQEFSLATKEISKGVPVEQALGNIKKRCNSRIIDRAINLLVLGYNSGADMSRTFKDAAEDILETQGILRERAATMIIEKYTLIFAGGLLVPAILGLLVGLVQGMNFSPINSLGIGLEAMEKKKLLEAAMLGNQVYIIEYALLASFFLANQEGNKKKAFLYALLLLPLSLASYSIAKGI